MVSLFNGAKGQWPKTSYMKAIDLWTLGCYMGVFYALAEYCSILYLTVTAKWEQKVLENQARNKESKSKQALFSARVMLVKHVISMIEI